MIFVETGQNNPIQGAQGHPKAAISASMAPASELRSLLIEKGGPNLRNLLAHGLLDAPNCYSVEGFYTWWLVLKIVVATSPAIGETLRAGTAADIDRGAATAAAAGDW
jgi:Domain of unknown function (DUF4209)